MVLRKRILNIIVSININDSLIIIAQVNGVIRFNIIVQIQKDLCFHVLLRFIDVHPEYIRQFSAHRTRLQQGPIFVPCDHININRNT